MNKILLQCDNLSKRYQEGTVQTDVLHNVSFSVGEGEMMAIVGSSGSGKSTLLHLLGGLDTPTEGDVIFSGQPMSKMSSAAKAELRNRELGFIYQFHHLLPDFTALENVAMPLLIGKKKPTEINARASDMLKAVGLGHRGNHRPSELSGGLARRAALARAIALEPDLIMFDEPFVGQDPITMGVLVKLISELNNTLGVTCIVVSHDVPEVLSIADYAYIVADKKIVAHGSAQSLRENTDPRVRQFIDGIADGPVPFRYPAGDYHHDLLGIGS